MMTSVEIKRPYILNKEEDKIFLSRQFLIQYLADFFNEADAYYNCEEIK